MHYYSGMSFTTKFSHLDIFTLFSTEISTRVWSGSGGARGSGSGSMIKEHYWRRGWISQFINLSTGSGSWNPFLVKISPSLLMMKEWARIFRCAGIFRTSSSFTHWFMVSQTTSFVTSLWSGSHSIWSNTIQSLTHSFLHSKIMCDNVYISDIFCQTFYKFSSTLKPSTCLEDYKHFKWSWQFFSLASN